MYLFEWDPRKAKANARKHGVTFAEATTVFRDALAMQMHDPDHSEAEPRYVLLGMSTRGRLLVVAFAERAPRTRLVTARPATRPERLRYEER